VDFRWNEWNVEHLGRHGVTPEAAEEVVEAARSPYPRKIGEDTEKRRYRRNA
jgi:heme oxygenase